METEQKPTVPLGPYYKKVWQRAKHIKNRRWLWPQVGGEIMKVIIVVGLLCFLIGVEEAFRAQRVDFMILGGVVILGWIAVVISSLIRAPAELDSEQSTSIGLIKTDRDQQVAQLALISDRRTIANELAIEIQYAMHSLLPGDGGRNINFSDHAKFLIDFEHLSKNEKEWIIRIGTILAKRLSPVRAANFKCDFPITENDKNEFFGHNYNGQYLLFMIRMKRKLEIIKSVESEFDVAG